MRQFLLQFAHCGGFSLRSKYKGRGGGGGLDLPLLIRLANFIYIFVVSSFIQIIQIVVVYSARCCCCKFTLCTFSILNFVLMLRKFILSIERNFCCFLLLVVVILGFYFTHTHATRGGEGDARLLVCGSRVRYNSRKFLSTLLFLILFFLASFSRCSCIRVSHATKAAPSKCNLLNSPRTCCMFAADSGSG